MHVQAVSPGRVVRQMTTVRPHTARGLLGNSIALLATTHITALLGYVFWTVCARSFLRQRRSVITNTVISAMTLVAMLTVAGFVPMLTRLLPGASSQERSGLCSTAFVVTAVVSGVAGVAAALLLPNACMPQSAPVGSWRCWVPGRWAPPCCWWSTRRCWVSAGPSSPCWPASWEACHGSPAIAALLTPGDGRRRCRCERRSHDSHFVGALPDDLRCPVHVVTCPCDAGLPVPPRPGSGYPLRRSVAGTTFQCSPPGAPVFVVPILASAIFPPAQVGYLALTAMISQRFLRGGRRSVQRTAGGLRRTSRTTPSTSAPRFASDRRASARPGGDHLPVGLEGARHVWRRLRHYSTLLILLLLSTFPDALINVAVAMLRVQRRLVAVAAVTVTGAAITIGGAWLPDAASGNHRRRLGALLAHS